MSAQNPSKTDIINALDLSKYIYKEVSFEVFINYQKECRATLKLRDLDLGYNNGRVLSVRKQLTMRDEFLNSWQEDVSKIMSRPPDIVDESSDFMKDTEQEIRLKRVQPIYRMLMSKDPKVMELCRRVMLSLEKLGVRMSVPALSKNSGLVKSYGDRILQGILGEIYQIYEKTVALQVENGFLDFEKMLRAFLLDYKQQEQVSSNPNFRQRSQLLKVKQIINNINKQMTDFIHISVSEREEPYHQMAALFMELDRMMDQIMSSTLCDEVDKTIPIYEWQFFDPMRNDYKDPLETLESQQPIEFDLDLPFSDFQPQNYTYSAIGSDRNTKNYVQEFYEKYDKVLKQASPEYWTLLIFDILQALCDSSKGNIELESQIFNLLKNVEATRYLMVFRRDIVGFLHRGKFWEQGSKKSNSNNPVLGLISEMDDQPKKKVPKQKTEMTLEQGLAVHDPNEYTKMDLSSLQKVFPTSSREDRHEYLKIKIDTIPRIRPQTEKLVPIESLPTWTQRAFEGTQALNVIQSVIYEKALMSEDNLLVCAPTGAGKTNIALLSILQIIEKRVDKVQMKLIDQNWKVVYISPMKALASEIVEKFQHKLKYMGVKVREYTGDMQLSKKELQETHIILTTPEKWDVVTRKGNSIQDQLQLLIIDEIHLLNDDRGAILECVVARTLKQVERAQRMIRMVGLSATLPNYWDVAVFLQVPREGVFFFDQSYRPVPLSQKFVGIKDPIQKQKSTIRRKKQDIYNEVCYDILSDVLKHQKQVLVFVHSRKETVNYAKYVVARAMAMNQMTLLQSSRRDLKALGKLTDRELTKLVPYSVGFHHAGMLRPDRNLVERMFLEGEIRVLVATATLAWGVNLPAYAVIIKGTDVFDMTRADMQNLSVLDVQQMFGRAGRPQYDSQGEATLITDINNIGHYIGSLNNASYIESRLMGFLKEALNAEIVLGTITNYAEAYDWLNHTFFSIRLKRNPLNYGVQKEFGVDLDCDILVGQKITAALQELDELRMVRFDTKNLMVIPTELGRCASHYYIKCETMKILCEHMGIHFDTSLPLERQRQTQSKYQYKNMYQLMQILARAKEFEVLRVRPEEIPEIIMIFKHYWIFDEPPNMGFNKMDRDVADEGEFIIETPEKVIALISGYISQVHYEVYALVMDTNLVIQNAIRLARCMLEMAIKKNLAQMVQVLLRMCKLLENRMSEGRTPLAQFSREIFTGYNARKRIDQRDGFIPTTWLDLVDQNAAHYPVKDFLDMNADELCSLLNCGRVATSAFRKFCHWLPFITIDYTIKPIASSILQIHLLVTPRFRFSPRWHLRQEPFWVIVDDEQEIVHCESFLIGQRNIEEEVPLEITFFVPYSRNVTEYRLIVTSDRWVMREEYQEIINLSGIVMEDDLVDFTDLQDLQPLPTRVLGRSEYEALFPFPFFNPIQTQVFHTLFHTDQNVLIGAPTGSGKTIMAEFAMFRVFVKTPDKKIVYIAPMKAIAKERLKDWTKRFATIGKSVVELTGDYTPDIAALMSADILITTPEKWDGISRSWHNRSYVQQSALIIFDEIHLLGQDRGPVLEVIVSRMNLVGAKMGGSAPRMVGLSTAMANGSDVGEWFGLKKQCFYNFKPSVRPVPVTIHFSGYPERAYCPRMATMNKPAFQDIKRHSDGKPVIVFVSSRRQTYLTAMDLIALQVQEHGSGNPAYVKCAQWEIEQYTNRVTDEYLKQTLGFGIGMHHAGLSSDDREIVEEVFLQAKIQVLVATSTLAWGVNLPARLVILKGTEFYDPKLKKYVDMPVTDILQMIGRAGRPQFDTQATACVYVEQSKKDFYRKYLNSPFPIESSLLTQLHDHINAEIVGGSICNRQQCIDWLTWTYFFRRLLKNPSYYGLINNDRQVVKKYLIELVDRTLVRLQEFGCIRINDEQDTVEPTFLGNLASFYYVRYQTIKHFNTGITSDSTPETLLRTLAYAHEFGEVPMRHNEDNMNEALAKTCPLKSDPRKFDQAQEKTFLLFQAHLFRLPVPIRDFTTDMKIVVDGSLRMLYAMIDLAAEKGLLRTTLNVVKLVQMLVQGVWEKQCLLNVPHFDQNIINQLAKINVISLSQLVEYYRKNPQNLKNIANAPESQWKQIQRAINQVPVIKVKVYLDGVDESTMKKSDNQKVIEGGDAIVTVNLQRVQNNNEVHGNSSQRVLIQRLTKVKDAGWWICVGVDDTLLAIKKIYFQKSTKKELRIVLPDNLKANMYLHLLSDSYIGLDQQIQLNLR